MTRGGTKWPSTPRDPDWHQWSDITSRPLAWERLWDIKPPPATTTTATIKRVILCTELDSIYYYLAISNRNRALFVTDINLATPVIFSDAEDIHPDGKTSHYIEIPSMSATGSGLLRPINKDKDSFASPLSTIGEGSLRWIRIPVEGSAEEFTLSLESKSFIASSHAMTIGRNKDPFPLISDGTDTAFRPILPVKFTSICICSCSMVTSNSDSVCDICRGLTDIPCECCGKPTPYGGFCSRHCKCDFTGIWN